MASLPVNLPTTALQNAANPEDVLHLFFCKRLSTHYHFRDGSSAAFVEGKYATKKASEITELQGEIDNGHPEFYIDPKRLTVTKEQLEPDYELRKRIREEEKAKLLANMGRDFGNSDPTKSGAGTGVATSTSVGAAAVESGTSLSAAALASLSNVTTVKSGPTK